MKKPILLLAGIISSLFVFPALAAAAAFPVAVGGTGISSLSTGFIPFGNSPGTAPFATSSNFSFSSSTNRLTLLYASTTAITSSGSAYFATASGKVGIGNGGPSQALDITVNGSSCASNTCGVLVTDPDATHYSTVKVANDGGVGGFLQVGGSGVSFFANTATLSGTNGVAVLSDNGVANGGSDSVNIITGGYSNNPTLTVTAGNPGNVGIGTTTPFATFSVQGPLNSSVVPITSAALYGGKGKSDTTFFGNGNKGSDIVIRSGEGGDEFGTLGVSGTGGDLYLFAGPAGAVGSSTGLMGTIYASSSKVVLNQNAILYFNGNGINEPYIVSGGGQTAAGALGINSAAGIEMRGQIKASPFLSSPQYSFLGDTSTGLGTPLFASQKMNFLNNGIETMRLDSNNKVGIGTTSPYALLSLQGGGSYASQAASTLFAIGSSTAGTATSTLFSINSAGDVITSGISPSLGVCGTATLSATSTDMRGNIRVTAGTPTSCLLKFSSTKSDTPTCIADGPSSALGSVGVTAASTTGVQFGLPAAFAGNIFYICLQ